METLHDIIARQHRERPAQDDPLTDCLMAGIVQLAEEVCVLRDRLDTCQRLAAAGEATDDAAIDAYDLSEELIEERLARHRRFFEEVLARIAEPESSGPP